jgi:hypothetical protein
MSRRINRMMSLLIIMAAMLACVPTLAPAAVPTYDPNSIHTIIVETANAALTQTALFTTPSSTPTATATFTHTPTETPTTVPTILILVSTPTVFVSTPQVSGTNDQFGCTILSQTPADGFGFSAGIEFTVTWQLLNSGKAPWSSANADLRYLSGQKMYVQRAYDLDNDVPPNGQYTASVQMKAPSEAGSYTTIWGLNTKDDQYCRMSISIQVQ